MPSLKVKVQRGSIQINCLWVVLDTPKCFVLEGDLKAKYAEIGCYACSDNEAEVFLVPGNNTLHTEKTEAVTCIKITNIPGFVVFAEIARYTLKIVGYRRPKGDSRKYLYRPKIQSSEVSSAVHYMRTLANLPPCGAEYEPGLGGSNATSDKTAVTCKGCKKALRRKP